MMKKIVITMGFLVICLQMAFSQFIYTEEGEPQPFSINSPYKELIKPEEMQANYVTKAYNNDSLFTVYNPILDRERIAAGFVVDSNAYDFRKVATHFDLNHGDLWLYKLTSPTAEDISVCFNNFVLPNGALISYFQLNGSSPLDNPPRSFANSSKIEFNGYAGCMGNELFIEYYEPKNLSAKPNVIFKYIAYGFTNGIRVNKKKDEPTLKSGSWGTSSFDCGNKLPCSGTDEWRTKGKSVPCLKDVNVTLEKLKIV